MALFHSSVPISCTSASFIIIIVGSVWTIGHRAEIGAVNSLLFLLLV